ncbi:MAG: ester cyclase [Solirubrobacterales bacterium]|nr:ester cyclase [Solirubrobacterales bacterium]
MATTTVDTAERERIQRDYLAAWNARDAERIASFFTEDAVYDDRGAAEVARGRAAIAAHAAKVHAAFGDLRFEMVRSAHAEDFSAGHWTSQMTHTGTIEGFEASGRVVTSEGVDVATLDAEGRITHLVSFYDGAQILRDLGVLPARGSRAERALAKLASVPARLRRR